MSQWCGRTGVHVAHSWRVRGQEKSCPGYDWYYRNDLGHEEEE